VLSEPNGMTNNGVCEHERIQPIQDHPSLGIRTGGIRVIGACRRTRPTSPEQGSGSGLQATAGRCCASVQAGPRTSIRAGGAGCPPRATAWPGCPRRLAGAQFRRTPLSRPPRLGGGTLASRGPRWT
jgi:hypothetical protein